MCSKTKLERKVAILTGATGGIGCATALALASRGMCMMLVGRNQEGLLKIAEEVRTAGGEAEIFAGDLGKPGITQLIIQETVEKFGGIDVLINNAGVAQNTSFADVTEEEYDSIMTLNVKAPYFLTQKALPYLLQSEMGTVINVCSVSALKGYVRQSVYGCSKSALLSWSKSLAVEYYEQNLRVHTICPGGVYTNMIAVARPDLNPDEMIDPKDIADIMLFFLDHRETNAVVDEIDVHRPNKTPFL